jgi:hypothetical protein
MTEYYDKLINAQELFLAKEQEIFSYINTHEIPDELRSILMEWINLKSQYSEIGTQYLNAQKQENREREIEREAREKEYEEKIKAIESQVIEGFVRFPSSTIHLVKGHQVLIEN